MSDTYHQFVSSLTDFRIKGEAFALLGFHQKVVHTALDTTRFVPLLGFLGGTTQCINFTQRLCPDCFIMKTRSAEIPPHRGVAAPIKQT